MYRLAHAFWPRFYRLLRVGNPVVAPIWRRFGIGNVVRVVVPGRRTRREREVYLGLLRVGTRLYLGHPDIGCGWTHNLEAAGGGELEFPDGQALAFRAEALAPGPERDAVVRATFRQHPFPGSVLYWLSRRHVRAVGRFYRLVPADTSA
jgi:hypothetical protein